MNYRRAARGKPCTIRHPEHCNGNTETTVLCHLRMLGGGGTGLKPDDSEAVASCSGCHDWLDNRVRNGFNKQDPTDWRLLLRAVCETHRRLT